MANDTTVRACTCAKVEERDAELLSIVYQAIAVLDRMSATIGQLEAKADRIEAKAKKAGVSPGEALSAS